MFLPKERRPTIRDPAHVGKKIPEHVRVEFFVGAGPQTCEAGVWELACEDSYEALPSKVQAFMAWALEEPEWDSPVQVR